jgi:multisubunit Na+/H+ antiporter MnhG subunit
MLLGNTGITFPLPAAVIFYLGVIYHWRLGVISAALTGVTIEMLYGSSSFMPLSLLLIVAIAQLWLNNYDTKNISALTVPGAIIGVILFIPQLTQYQGSWASLLYLTPKLLYSIISMMMITPLTIYLLDKISKATGLPLFKEAAIKQIHKKR